MGVVFHTIVTPAAAEFSLFRALVAGALRTSRASVGIVKLKQQKLQLMHVSSWKLFLPPWKQNSRKKINKELKKYLSGEADYDSPTDNSIISKDAWDKSEMQADFDSEMNDKEDNFLERRSQVRTNNIGA